MTTLQYVNERERRGSKKDGKGVTKVDLNPHRATYVYDNSKLHTEKTTKEGRDKQIGMK
jgi:hypothetical protein